jgi:hypothetical protein
VSRRLLLLSLALCSCLALAPPLAAQQVITLLSRVQVTGTIKSVAPGILVVSDESGRELTYKIQDRNEKGVSLAGARAIIDFPAKVQVTGSLAPEALAKGTLIRFTGQVNRVGRTDGTVAEVVVFDEGREPPGVTVVEEPAERGGFAKCTIRAEVYTLSNKRLMVATPKNDLVRAPRLSFPVDAALRVTVESDDYRKVRAGDKVTRLVAAKFSTGDAVIQEVAIELAPRSKATAPSPDRELGKYRQLSDAPGKPRDLRSAHFLLHTDVSDRSAKMLVDKLETMITLVSQYFGRPPVGILECYVVRDLHQWPTGLIPADAVAKIAEPAGVTKSISVGNRTHSVVYSCDKPGVVQHEAIHAYCSQTFGSTGPTWYAEGIAEMGQYWKKDQLAVDIDPVVIDHLKHSPPKRLLDIVAAGQITGDSWQAYAWRWALCHLLAHNPNYMGPFKNLGVAMMSRQPGASFESAYGAMARELSFEYDLFTQQLDNGYRCDLCAWQWNRKFLAIPGTRYATTKVLARYGWQASGVKLDAGQSYDYVAKGTWKVAAGDEELDANGQPDGTGRLLGIVLKDFTLSEPLPLGAKGSFTAPRDGHLYLRCQESWNALADNDGELTVHFRHTPAER